MCTLSAAAQDVNSLPARTLSRQPVGFSAWSGSPDGSDTDTSSSHWTRPGDASAEQLARILPPAARWSAWWPGTGLSSYIPPQSDSLSSCCEDPFTPSAVPWSVELTQGLSSIPGPDRRRSPRVPGLTLTESERDRLRSQLATVAGCGRSHAAYLRCLPGESSCTLQRLVCQRYCGIRQCPDCDAQRRKRSTARVAGPWRTFVTMGLPARSLSVRAAWSSVHRWIEELARALRRAASFERDSIVRVDPLTPDYCTTLKIAAGRARQLDTLLDYAWAIEPHKSGYPHVHLCTTAEFINGDWLRWTWRRITACPIRWAHVERVTDSDGVCWYLAKYVSKAQLPLDLLAILYRRRLWSCTLPVWDEDPSWSPEPPDDSGAAWRSVLAPASWAQSNGWTLDSGSPGRYATWSRPVSWSHVASRLPESLADDQVGTMLWLRALFPGYSRGVPYSRDPLIEHAQGYHKKNCCCPLDSPRASV